MNISQPYQIDVQSSANLDDNLYTVVIKDTVSYTNSAGTLQQWAPTQTFVVTVTDPCLTTVITDFTINNMTIECG